MGPSPNFCAIEKFIRNLHLRNKGSLSVINNRTQIFSERKKNESLSFFCFIYVSTKMVAGLVMDIEPSVTRVKCFFGRIL